MINYSSFILCNLCYCKHKTAILSLQQENFKMLGKGTKLYSVLRMKCPKCHLKYELETGFYQGSYYVSYGLGVALFIMVVVLNITFREEITPTFLILSFLFSLIVFFSLMYALSKMIWINLFVKYDKSYSSKKS